MYTVPEGKKIRLIIDTDAKCEADDAYAVVQALLTPKFIVKGVIAEQFDYEGNHEGSMMRSYEECRTLVKLLHMEDKIPVLKGAVDPIVSEDDFEYSEGADFIYREAMRDDPRPLFVTNQGALTNLAAAYLKHPEIAGRFTAVWIGGGKYPKGGWEFNLKNDYKAANVIFKSGIELWQIPINVYKMVRASFAELEEKVAPMGAIGKYIYDEMIKLNDKLGDNKSMEWPPGESWNLGDQPSVGVLLEDMSFFREEMEAPTVDENYMYHFDGKGRKILVYNNIDVRYIMEDLFAKLKKFAENE